MGTFDKYFENIHFDIYLIILKVYNIFRIIKGGFYNGIYSSVQQSAAETTYKNAKKYLKPSDGKLHVIMFNSFSKLANQVFSCEDKYTTQIDTILSAMQEDGYEIIDVKVTVIQNQGITGELEGFNTLITYR